MTSALTASVARDALPAYPIEISCPNIAPARYGNTGVDYVHRIQASESGPTVMLNALTHGNEYSGAEALLQLLNSGLRPRCGTWIISFANVEAFARFDPALPDASRFVDTDMNRVWSSAKLDGTPFPQEVRRARDMLPFVRSADFLLDLHSMHEACEPLLLSGLSDKAFALAKEVGYPRAIIRDAGHADGKRLIDFEAFGDLQASPRALLVEAGQHWSKDAIDASMHTLFRFLISTRTIAAEDAPHAYRQTLPQVEINVVERCVALSAEVRFAQNWQGMEVIPRAGTVIAYDGEQPVTTPFDDCVLVMPSLRQVKAGVTYVRFGRQTAI